MTKASYNLPDGCTLGDIDRLMAEDIDEDAEELRLARLDAEADLAYEREIDRQMMEREL